MFSLKETSESGEKEVHSQTSKMGRLKDVKEELKNFCFNTSIQGLRYVADQVTSSFDS